MPKSNQVIRPFARAHDSLRNAGLRPSRQRLALYRLLFDSEPRHVTAELLHSEATTASISVSLATVYNTLHQFVRAGLLQEVIVDSYRSYFDTNIKKHHHFFDEETCLLQDIPSGDISISHLPATPDGKRIARIDIVVRLEGDYE